MLKIKVPSMEFYDESKNEFITTKEWDLQLEHSLVSLSKWESKWLVPFLSKGDKTREQTIDYIRCMTITQNVPDSVFLTLPSSIIEKIMEYIHAPMSATTFAKQKNNVVNREVITSEIVYYWMVAFSIPFECEKWHLNRLLSLINVCNIKNQPAKKMSNVERKAQYKSLNEQRKALYHTKG